MSTPTLYRDGCGKANCRCHGDPPQPHGPYIQWTAKVDGKIMNRRLSPREAELFREWIDNDRRLRAQIDQLRALAAEATDLIIEEARRTGEEVELRAKNPRLSLLHEPLETICEVPGSARVRSTT